MSIVNKVDKRLPHSVFYSFIMSSKEKKLFDKRIAKSKFYLEFGMGGSTFRVLQKSKAKVFSMDSSSDWIALMREYAQIRKMEKRGRLTLFHIDIGPTRDWGRPVNVNDDEKFPNYSSQIFKLIDKDKVDTVLIDGRFRIACALMTILELHGNSNLQIIIHDFWIREEYHILLNYFEVIDQAESLGVFKLKSNIDLNLVRKEYESYKYYIE